MAALAIGAAIVASQWVRIMFDPSGDFANHWTSGLRFVRGDPLYTDGLNLPYPPFWAMAHAPLTMMPAPGAQLIVYPLGVAALVVLLWVLNRMTRDGLPRDGDVDDARLFWVGAATLTLASRFIVRDLADSGPNLMLVALTWGAIFLWSRQRVWLGGAVMGIAIALKLTAALFVAYFLLRRQWRFAAVSLAVALMLTLAPAIWQGPEAYRAHMQTWVGTVRSLWMPPDTGDDRLPWAPKRGDAGARRRHPDLTPLSERVDNIALGPAIARHLMQTQASEQLRARSALWPDPALVTLTPVAVAWIIAIGTFALIVALSVAFSGRLASPGDPRVVWECAAVGILALLLSPITWRQHAVAIVPACHLLVRLRASRGTLPPSAWAALGLLALSALVLSRGLMGEHVSFLVQVYSLHTWTLVALLAATVRCRPRV